MVSSAFLRSESVIDFSATPCQTGILSLTSNRVKVEASSVRRLFKVLDERFPGIAERLAEGTAVAIDGVIVNDALYEDLPDTCEVHFLPALAGG